MKKTRRGGTLIELLVALVLLDLALLSLAAVGALTAKRIGDAGRRSRATTAATNRVERLSALPCTGSGGAALLERGVTESWIADRRARSLEITDSLEIVARPIEHVVVRRSVPCL